jgi:hypothetical protein
MTARQPADIAAFESSAKGAAVNERAIAYWLSHNEELSEELIALGAGRDRTAGSMHVAQAISADAPNRLSRLAAAARSSQAAVAIAAVAGGLAEYLDRSSLLMFITSANRHLAGVKHTVCSLAQAGLIHIGVPDPRDLGRLIPATCKSTLTALQYAYYDEKCRTDRQRAAGGSGHRLLVSPPSVNVMRVDGSTHQLPPGWEPDGGTGQRLTRIGQVDRPCPGLNFHVQIAGSYTSIELRAGTQLLPAADCEALVAGAMDLITNSP